MDVPPPVAALEGALLLETPGKLARGIGARAAVPLKKIGY